MQTINHAALAAALLCFPFAARAQDAAPADEPDIVVTAQKREQRAGDVPLALTAYDARSLERLGITDLEELARFTPGLAVQEQSPNNPGFIIRGITSSELETTFEPRVSIFQDGVQISKGEGSYVALFDVERIEVAKGPQSTLFGRGALIGAINIIQNKASPDAFGGHASIEGGTFNAFKLDGAINMPLGQDIAARVATSVSRRDGFVDNLLGGDDFQSTHYDAFRGTLSWRGEGGASVDLIANYQRDQPTGTGFKSGVLDPADPVTGAVLGSRSPGGGVAMAVGPGFPVGREIAVDREVWGVTALAQTGDMNGFRLSSTSAFRQIDSREINDPDGTALPILTASNQGRADQWSQELRVNFDRGGRLSWFAGASIFRFEGEHETPIQFDERLLATTVTRQLNGGAAGTGLPPTRHAPIGVLTNPAFTTALLQGLAAGLSNNVTTPGVDPMLPLTAAQAGAIAANLRPNHGETAFDSNRLTSVDLFADATYKLTDRLTVSAGLRYTHDDKTSGFASSVNGRSALGGLIGAARLAGSGDPAKLAQAQAIVAALQSPGLQQIPATALPLFGVSFQPTTGNGGLAEQELTDDGLTWRIVGQYEASAGLNLYASYARGRRPEVLVASAPSAPFGAVPFSPLPAETVDSFEIGGKLRLADPRLSLDAAIYRFDYRNFQTIIQDGARLVPDNAGRARAYGVELQLDWNALDNFDVLMTYAYNHARFTNGAFEGNSLRQSPDHAASIGLSWRTPMPGGTLEIRPTLSVQSKMFFEDDNDRPELQQPPASLVGDLVQDEFQKGFALLDLAIAWKPRALPLTVEAFGKNLTDTTHVIDAGNTGDVIGLPTFVTGAPRTVGLRLSATF